MSERGPLHPDNARSWISDEVLRGLVDAAPDALVMVDHDGLIVLVNRQTEALFGYERSELLGRSVEELVPERFRPTHRAHRVRYGAEPRTRPMGAGIELRARRRDGTEFRVEISLSPMSIEGAPFFVAAVRDITERIQAEAHVRRIQELLDATRDGIYIWDAESLRFTYVNQGAVDQVGYRRDELTSMSMPHIAPELGEAGWRALLEPLEDGTVSSTMFTTTLRARDGTDIPSEVLLQVNEDDRARAFICVVRDIRERVEAEERLRHADHELRLLEDRDRIARDLHDTVIQRLFAAGMTLQATLAMLGARHDAGDRIEHVVEELDDTIRELRQAIYGLQSPRTDGPLSRQITEILAEERDALEVRPRLVLLGDVDKLPDEVAEHLVATIREALSNVARHADANEVEVVVDVDDEVLLRVADDGVGIGEGALGMGRGLRNMTDRARELGGRCEVRPGEGGGLVVDWRVPNPSPPPATSASPPVVRSRTD